MVHENQQVSGPGEEAKQLREVLRRVSDCVERLEASCQSCGERKLAPAHADALLALYEYRDEEHGIPMSELVDALTIDQSNVSRLCARMERDGEIERKRCTEDARVRRIALTERGLELARALDERAAGRFAALMEQLDEGGKEDVRRGLAALERALEGCFG